MADDKPFLTLAKVSYSRVTLVYHTKLHKKYKRVSDMVYVLDMHGHALMPTDRHGTVRRLLKTGKAKVTKRYPFTIQLLYETMNHTQKISLGVDAGGKTIGVSATTETKVLYEAEIHLKVVENVTKILPVTRIIVETASFDIQRIKHPEIEGTDYQHGEQLGIMRWEFYGRLKDKYMPLGVEVSNTYGYLTKNTRITCGLPKMHYADARCISGKPLDFYYHGKKVRCHNRQIHKEKAEPARGIKQDIG